MSTQRHRAVETRTNESKAPAPDAVGYGDAPRPEDEGSTSAPWLTQLVDKVSQTALLLVATKLVSAWVVVAVWGVDIQSRMAWGIVPYAGLRTSPDRFRLVAAYSSATVAVVAAIWLLAHFVRRHREPAVWTWGAASSIPMAALLVTFEWFRRFDIDPLIPTYWMVRIGIFLGIAAVLFLGFIEYPGDEERETKRQSKNAQRPSLPSISAQP
ncbi:MAG: hypothetical protein AAF567_09340 [Actinomycetota bacterium]